MSLVEDLPRCFVDNCTTPPIKKLTPFHLNYATIKPKVMTVVWLYCQYHYDIIVKFFNEFKLYETTLDNRKFVMSLLSAHDEVKGYKYHCGTNMITIDELKCRECSKSIVEFVTTDINQAIIHSSKNNIPMWIYKEE